MTRRRSVQNSVSRRRKRSHSPRFHGASSSTSEIPFFANAGIKCAEVSRTPRVCWAESSHRFLIATSTNHDLVVLRQIWMTPPYLWRRLHARRGRFSQNGSSTSHGMSLPGGFPRGRVIDSSCGVFASPSAQLPARETQAQRHPARLWRSGGDHRGGRASGTS
jgi:hypothetical protein